MYVQETQILKIWYGNKPTEINSHYRRETSTSVKAD